MRGRDVSVVVLLAVLALATVPLAVGLDSVIPLFCAWIPQLLILVYIGRMDRANRSSSATSSIDEGRPAEATGAS